MSNQSCIRLFADHKKNAACKERLVARNCSHSPAEQCAGTGRKRSTPENPELCPCDLSDILGMSVPAVSQHLRKMKDGNIIASRREGQTLFYSLKSRHLDLLKVIFNHLNIVSAKEELV